MLSPYYKERGLLILSLALALALFAVAGSVAGVPDAPGFGGSLLRGATPAWSVLVVVVTLGVATGVGTGLAGRWKADLGLASAAAGMAALSVRGGPIGSVYLYAAGRSVYLVLILEAALLFGLIFALYFALRATGVLTRDDDPELDPDAGVDPDEPLDQKLLGTVTALVTAALLMVVLCRTDAKAQCLASVFASTFLGVLCAHQFVPARPGGWYWACPLLLAVAGYGLGFLSPGGLSVGEPGGYLAPLARPLPLDYASAGVLGSALAYHLSRRLRHDRAASDAEDTDAVADAA